MPLADFSGHRNWGYDGVLWYAPDSAYGRPDDLKALIDEAHLRGLMVFLDVVYNHFGPEGNYLGRYAPAFFTDAQTPWGSAIDYRVPEVRAFAIENALYWLRDYRFDGLRLDAVHAIAEPGEISMLDELSRAVGDLAAATGRHIHLVLENDDNAAHLLDAERRSAARQIPRAMERRLSPRLARAADRRDPRLLRRLRGASPLDDIARALGSGFAYQGEASAHRERPAARRAERQARADRLRQFPAEPRPDRQSRARRPARSHADPRAIEAALAITLLAPMLPMLFMGEEWGAERRFRSSAISRRSRRRRARRPPQGIRRRLRQIRRRDSRSARRHRPFNRRCWIGGPRAESPGRDRLALVRELLSLRQREIVPRLAGARFGARTGDGRRPADAALADGRRRDAAG